MAHIFILIISDLIQVWHVYYEFIWHSKQLYIQ